MRFVTRYILIALFVCLASRVSSSNLAASNSDCITDYPGKSLALVTCFNLKAGRSGHSLGWTTPCDLNGDSDVFYSRLLNGTSLPPGTTPIAFAIPGDSNGLNAALQCAEKHGINHILTLGGPQVGGGGKVLPFSCSLGSAESSPLLVIELNILARRNVGFVRPK